MKTLALDWSSTSCPAAPDVMTFGPSGRWKAFMVHGLFWRLQGADSEAPACARAAAGLRPSFCSLAVRQSSCSERNILAAAHCISAGADPPRRPAADQFLSLALLARQQPVDAEAAASGHECENEAPHHGEVLVEVVVLRAASGGVGELPVSVRAQGGDDD